jgi:mRNA interferase MazF
VTARGEVWLALLDPAKGNDPASARQCLIVSPAELYDFLDTVVVAPLATGSRAASFRLDVKFNDARTRVLLDQMRTIEKGALLRRVGTLGQDDLASALAILRDMFTD